MIHKYKYINNKTVPSVATTLHNMWMAELKKQLEQESLLSKVNEWTQ